MSCCHNYYVATEGNESVFSVDISSITFGHGVLKEAGISEASMVIAVTNSDEANMISCLVAGVQDRVPKKIARVRDPDYSESRESRLRAALPAGDSRPGS